MTSEINEKEFDRGVIEYEGLQVCLVRKIQITNASLSQDGIQRIFMTKEYQNDDVREHEEIDDKLMQIYERNDSFLANCFDGEYYTCRLLKNLQKGKEYCLEGFNILLTFFLLAC